MTLVPEGSLRAHVGPQRFTLPLREAVRTLDLKIQGAPWHAGECELEDAVAASPSVRSGGSVIAVHRLWLLKCESHDPI